ncbi:LacI family DNA-binding transcriptional regulator [Ensifer sp. ENS09]|uniref:LacI family DNA-binding transcriptional regulator n=1 Tax=Ensifer sp. ENS09 TaxID=2769263 RepID=UPI0017810FAE|nr:LacI family DNA-binding transcriptional regulator [Ensifer sp. ENS09]MBD9650077.1 LacI family DNA-binding transcriptional regulator [Ensifer sp. ENS09]
MTEKKSDKLARTGTRSAVTLQQVAERAGVGVMTASRAINSPHIVSEKLRLRVQAAIRDLGYLPNEYAGRLSSNRSKIVVFVLPSVSIGVFRFIIQGAEEVLSPLGYQVMVTSGSYSLEEEEVACWRILGWRPEGVVLSGTDHTEAMRAMLLAADIPVVEALELGDQAIDINIGLSHQEAGRAAARHLFERGYRRLGFLGSSMKNDYRAQRRREGFLGVVQEAGLSVHWDVDHPGKVNFETGAVAATHLIESANNVDAIFCSSDELAVGAVGATLRAGRKIPQDLAIIGFNDLDISSHMVPSITSIRTPRLEIGRLAADAILTRIDGGQYPKRVDVGFELIVRETT